jgi:hypothetical protein
MSHILDKKDGTGFFGSDGRLKAQFVNEGGVSIMPIEYVY